MIYRRNINELSSVRFSQLIEQRQLLEQEIAQLDEQILNCKQKINQNQKKISTNYQIIMQERKNFEQIWKQIEQMETTYYHDQPIMDDDQWLQLIVQQSLKDQQMRVLREKYSIQKKTEKSYDAETIDNLAKEVEELLSKNTDEKPEQTIYIIQLIFIRSTRSQSQNRSYIPPLCVIEEEQSVEISMVQD